MCMYHITEKMGWFTMIIVSRLAIVTNIATVLFPQDFQAFDDANEDGRLLEFLNLKWKIVININIREECCEMYQVNEWETKLNI